MPLETTITGNIIKYINSLEGCVAEKIAGNAFQRDKPDINASIKGRCYKIEVKSPDHDNKPTKGQIMELKRWARAGAISLVVWNVKEVKLVVENSGVYAKEFTGWYIKPNGEIIKGRYKDGC